ncbi:hypothetical protein SAMN04487870_3382 [Pseudoalteromonas sp. DSM 26666]|uniref:hypothetical protein n=1 Tax=Pseudoalteromonas sp. DSM 26666 TaxID=1761892 RepID=UPI0008F314FD|nr:hypothetical protein [Pseudoalteromonas sp. DSM 26666]SFU07517.1 hypothetical protein SAMN04487870_3382 [Pseudoalteromonas sp. DSM 26666]
MIKPVIEGSRGKKSCRKFVEIAESWFVKYIFRPIFFLFPPILLTFSVTRKGIQQDIIDLFGQFVGTFLNNSALVIIIGAYLYVVILKAIFAAIKNYSMPEKELEADDLIALIKAIDIVVGDKTKRMGNEAKKIINMTNACSKTTFNQITRPDQQIPLLIAGLRSVFEYMDEQQATFRVGLIRVINKKPDEWFSFDPASLPPRTPANKLSAPSSTVSHAIKSKSIVVIENIQKELEKKAKSDRRFMKGNIQDNENGSQLSYPIIHPATGEVEYVITIAANREDSLKDKYKELYSWIINHFAVRIAMEHSLLLMKEKAA